ncbi:MAG: hypothetical protein HUU25_13800 [Candidatus Sumerlaeia bacterium]|nr:hypothetical protein [Candidatus Sumerlaeia bacterium]
MELSPAQQRRVDGIVREIDEYLTLRFGHAERVNPKIGQFVDDLKAQLLVNLRAVLTKGKAWGAEKRMVADVLCGDDLDKRYALLNTTGQYSIMHEVITSLAESDKADNVVHIGNMRDLYQAIDPSISSLIELAETWIWWDLPDGVTLQAHSGQLTRIHRLADMEITEQVTDHYRQVLSLEPGTPVTREMMLRFEVRRLHRLMTEFELRRRDDLAHTQVLKRDIVEAGGVDQMILDLGTEIQTLQRLERAESFDEPTIEHFARKLAADPAHVERHHIIDWQREHIARLKQQVWTALHTGQVLGEPRNFKLEQLARLRAEFEGILRALPELAPEGAAAP